MGRLASVTAKSILQGMKLARCVVCVCVCGGVGSPSVIFYRTEDCDCAM